MWIAGKGAGAEPASPPASILIFWLCLEQPDTGVTSLKVQPWLYLLSHPGHEPSPCHSWPGTPAIHQVLKQHPAKRMLARACWRHCPDSHGRIPNTTFQNSVLVFLGFVLTCRIFRWSNYSFPKNWFLFGKHVQNTQICCVCLICKALEQTHFHLFLKFLN